MVFWPSTLTRWDPWLELRMLERDLQPWPAIRAKVEEDGVKLRALVPGYATEDLEVTVRGDVLHLRGKRKAEAAHEVHEFERSLQLPYAVEADKVKAVAKDGVLDVELPRAAADAPRRITVRSE